MTEPKDPIERILRKLDLMRRRGCKPFGAEQHKLRLNPRLSDSAAAAFECEHRIELPADYRAFLLRGGNGGAGPSYGIYPLEDWDRVNGNPLPDYLARPSPLRPGMREGVPWEEVLACEFDELFQG